MPTREGPTCGGSCGVERWAVKTLSDPDRERVQLRPVNTTVEALVAIQRPAGLSITRRADPTEVTVYRVEARLLSLFGEADGDYHLVLASPRDATITMIAEVPDPGCAGACASGFAGVYAVVRQKLMDYLNSPQSPRRMRARVVLGTAAARASARRLMPRALRSRSTRRVAVVRGGGMVRHYGAATEREQARRTARAMVVGQFCSVTGLRSGGLGPACCSGHSSLQYRLCDPFENRELKENHRTQGFAPCLPNPTTP